MSDRRRRRSAGGKLTLAGPHAWWRLEVAATEGSITLQICNLEFRQVAGVTQLATGGTALASSEFNGSYVVANLFDGQTFSPWATAGSTFPGWAQYHFAAPIEVAQMMIQGINNGGALDQNPKNFSLRYSDDGITWNNALVIANDPVWTVAAEIRTYNAP